MNKENISKIISDIDDRFIEEAAVPEKKKTVIFRYIGIAACVAVLAVSVFLLSENYNLITPPSPAPVGTEDTAADSTSEEVNDDKTMQEIVTTPAIQEETEIYTDSERETVAEMGQSPHWGDLITPEKYGEVTVNNITYSTQICEISEENVLDFISDAEMSGYDIYEDKTYTVNAKVYSIKNILSECAVAVKIGDENKYYVYVNVWYTPETLGDLINALDLKNTVVFGKAYDDTYEYSKTASAHTRKTYENFDDDVVWNMLLSDITVKNVEYNHPYDRIDIETDLPVLGYKNISFSVTTDGYIITNILNFQKCFFVGTEKTDAFADYLEKNVPFKEYTEVYEYNPDGSIPGKEEAPTVQIAPGYNPETDQTPPTGNASAVTQIPEDFVIEETTKS